MNLHSSHDSPMGDPFELVVSRLDGCKPTKRGVRAICPVHENRDSKPSLDVDRADDGKVLIRCRSKGCDAEAIVVKLGLPHGILLRSRSGSHDRNPTTKTKGTSYPSADALGNSMQKRISGKLTNYDYHDESGTHVGRVFRFDVEGEGKQIRQGRFDGKGWTAEGMPEPRHLYRLPGLLAAKVEDLVFVTEGEKCADSVHELELLATTSSQGAQSPHKSNWVHLRGRRVVILKDNDEQGRKFAQAVSALLNAAGATAVAILSLDGIDVGGDVFDWIRMQRDSGKDTTQIASELMQLADKALVASIADAELGEPAEHVAPFPLLALPATCRWMAEEGSLAHSVDPAFFAVPMLPILAGCIGNSRAVLVKEGWLEPSVIWAGVVAHSGVGKSPPLRQLLQPIQEREQALDRRYAQECMDYQQAIADRGKDKEIPLPPRPVRRGLLVQDATWEALASRLEANPRGLLMVQDELAGWFKSFNKYRTGDDREKWLSHYDASAIRVDRKGQQGLGPSQVSVARAAVSVVGTVQPRIAAECTQGSSEDSGLSARFRLALPPSRPAVWSDKAISEAVRTGWKQVVEGLLDLSFEPESGPKLIRLSPAAQALFIQYHDHNGLVAHEAGCSGSEGLASELAKLRGYAARLALILEMARAAESGDAERVEEVGDESMRSSIEITEWFEREARRFRRLRETTTPEAEERLERKICEKLGKAPLSAGQLRDSFGRNVSAEDIGRALVRLKGKGLARDLGKQPRGPTGGRPLELWELTG